MAELLLEIGTEEIPAGYIQPALSQLRSNIEQLCEEQQINYRDIYVYGTPRRLAIYVTDVAELQKDTFIEIMGPPYKIAYDSFGEPTNAAKGFAKAQGVRLEELKIKDTPKGKYVYAEKHVRGKETHKILQDKLPEIVIRLSFPKSMKWGEKNIYFARPIRWLLALFDNKIIPFEIDGIHTGNVTFGHRFLAPDKVSITHPSQYVDILEKVYVIVDIEKRKQMIISQIKDMLTTLKAAFMIDETLLNEVTHLVEYPIVIKGEFDRKYLNLPQDVIVTSMCEHQRYFPVWDKEQNLMPYFLIVSNTIHDIETIQEGNERVLRARLDDAVFYWDIDSKVLLKDRVEQEKKVIWQEQAGTLWDKTQRIVKISRIIVQHIALEYEEEVVKVAYLSKADLLTEMVGEFPVLQGVMGYYYALAQGEPENIARGIKEHYMPRSAEDSIPETLHGAIVSIADKIDSIVVCFSIGLIPTGSEDPYALRRQAQGIINIILGHKLDINLKWLVTHACNIWKEQQKEEENVDMDIGSIMEFLKQRLEYIFISKGFDVDSVAAVLEVNATSPIDILQRIEALTKIRDMAEIDALGILFKRVINILDTRKGQMYHKLDKTLFIGDAERKLYDAVIDTRQKVDKLLQQTKYFDALYEISTLKDVIDMFFDKVMVMVEDKRLQTNRLALLDNIAELFLRIADLSKLKDI